MPMLLLLSSLLSAVCVQSLEIVTHVMEINAFPSWRSDATGIPFSFQKIYLKAWAS